MPRLAQATDDHSSAVARLGNQMNSAREMSVQPRGCFQNGLGFQVENAAGCLDDIDSFGVRNPLCVCTHSDFHGHTLAEESSICRVIGTLSDVLVLRRLQPAHGLSQPRATWALPHPPDPASSVATASLRKSA